MQTVQTEYKLNNDYQTYNVKVSNQSSLVLELGLWNFVKVAVKKKATDQAIEHVTCVRRLGPRPRGVRENIFCFFHFSARGKYNNTILCRV